MAELTPIQEELEKNRKFVLENEWMIRPCKIYNLEYKECTKLRSRFYQYYRDGELTDCNPWKFEHKLCTQLQKKDDFASGAQLVRLEMERLDRRAQLHRENDVWKPRIKRPPPNWNVLLPEKLQEKQKESYFIGKEEEMKSMLDVSSSWCSIA